MTPPSLAVASPGGLPPLPDPLPEGWVFTEDDDMGHSFDQFEFILYLTSLLRAFLARQGKACYVGSDQHICLDPFDARLTVAPDVYVLPQPDPPVAPGATWSPMDNHGLVPELAFEYVSPSNRKKDYHVAPDKYARLGVRELVVFEPWEKQPGLRAEGDAETFRVYRLDGKRQWKQVYGGDGPTFSQVLGLWLHEDKDGQLLLTEDRWGKRALLTPDEMLSVESEARKLAEERVQGEAEARLRAEERAAGEGEARLRAEQALRSLEEQVAVRGKAEAVLAVLAARGLAVSEAQAAQVRACSEVATLEGWLKRAISAASTKDVFAAPARKKKR